ncbi:hypothetical protein AGMMS50262_16510 [Bacteroidia bacterium]|nr:hypothetical protein AGMMS50262_16510 [Bacteroidia bacterium]
MIMATITLNYNARNSLINSIIGSAILAGAKVSKATSLNVKGAVQKRDFFDQPVAKQYEYFFGKKKEYTENEVFAYNSILNVNKIVAGKE